MAIDNISHIIPFLKFESEDDFYYLQILQRKKENETLNSNSRVIKNYYIKSVDYLVDKYEEIKILCKVFNARASIRLNKRSFRKVAFKAMELTCNTLSNQTYGFVCKSYDRASAQTHNDHKKKWILDVDSTIIDKDLIPHINDLKGTILSVLESRSGFHIITNPFRLDTFKERFPDIEVHKDNPTNLYIS